MTPKEPKGGEGLKPCPLCEGVSFKRAKLRTFVECGMCGCTGPSFSHVTLGHAEASGRSVAAWNRRPPSPSGGEGEAVAWRWRNRPDGVWNYQEAQQRIPGVEQQPLYASPQPERMPTRIAVIEAMNEHLDAVLIGPREDRAGVDAASIGNAADAILALFHNGEAGEG